MSSVPQVRNIAMPCVEFIEGFVANDGNINYYKSVNFNVIPTLVSIN